MSVETHLGARLDRTKVLTGTILLGLRFALFALGKRWVMAEKDTNAGWLSGLPSHKSLPLWRAMNLAGQPHQFYKTQTGRNLR